MLTFVALPFLSRCAVTPGRRASDSAIVVSGSLPMSSEEIASTIWSEFFFTEIAASMPRRMPVTRTCCVSGAEAAAAGPGAAAACACA